MTPPTPSSRVLLAALVLGASLPASAGDPEVPAAEASASSSKGEPVKTPPLKPAEQIKNACEAPAVSVRLLDAPPPAKDAGKDAPAKREKEAQRTADRLGEGVENEEDEKGQTLSWKRGKTTKKACRQKLERLHRDYSGRISFEPTTEERVAEVRRRRDALIPENLRRDAADASIASGFFDGGIFGKMFGGKPSGPDAGPAAAGPSAARPSPAAVAAAAAYAPSRQLPSQYRGALTYTPPAPMTYEPPTFTQRVSSAYDASAAYVSQSIDEAGEWVSGVARSVRNRFYSGIEMIQGYGYSLIRAGRGANWGTKPLVDGLRSIAAYMRGTGRAETDLAVGDISSAKGGKLGGHASHQTGRDVDIGFYITDAATGKPVNAMNFVEFSGGKDGLSGTYEGRRVRFDAERNWYLVQAILANPDPEFKPTYIFVNSHLERAVLAAAGDAPEKARAAELMRPWPGHGNHYHLRIQ